MAWIEKLTADIDENGLYTSILYCDNQGGLDWIKDCKFYNKSKYIRICYMFVQTNIVKQSRLKVEHILRKDQIADILTKQLPEETFRKHTRTIELDIQ
jgi:hypothetical protein